MDCWLLAFAFMYVAMDFLVFIVFYFMDTRVLIVIYCDLLCYLVYQPQGCNKLELSRVEQRVIKPFKVIQGQ